MTSKSRFSLVKPKNQNGSGDVIIAVGYGLEGAIPDAYAKRIIEEIMVPKFKEDQKQWQRSRFKMVN